MIYLGLGSNLSSTYGDRFYNIDLAVSYLQGYGIQLIGRSNFYETPSYPNKKNPKFINIIISVNTNLPPEDLMSVIIYIEEKIERKRETKNNPRTCDIDIIDYNGEVHASQYRNEEFVVPHKELSLRNFVLFPLKEMAPKWVHLETKETIDELINKLSLEDKKSILKIKKS